MSIIYGILGFVLLCIIVLVLFCIRIYNLLIKLDNKYKNAWSQIKVQLNRRYDLIPNLVNAVKGYLKHEQETLQKVIEARNIAVNSKNISENIANENILSGALKSLFAVVEQYPDLKANQNVMQLQEELVSTENRISYSRQHYNDMVMLFNTKINSFPENIIANFFNFKEQVFFNVKNDEVLKRPEVSF